AVAVVVIPGDVLIQPASHAWKTKPIRMARPDIVPSGEELNAAANLLNAAEKVTILAGAGCKDAHAELMATAEMLQAPVVHAFRGKEYIEYDNPYDVGMTGLLGFHSGYVAMERCDVLLMLGTDFPYTQFFPRNAEVIQIDLRGEQLGRRTPIDLGLIGSLKATLPALNSRLSRKSDSAHLDHCVENYRSARKELDYLAGTDGNRTPIHPQYVARLVNELAAEDAIFTCDVGTPTIWAARYLRLNGKRRLVGSFSHGSMANALPHAIGAQAAFPDRQVITFSGDGGLAMMLGDLLTLKQLKLPIKIVVFNNGSLAFVELEMKAAGFVNFGTDLQNPNFSALGRALDMHCARVEKPLDLEAALRDALAVPGPALVEVMVNRQELSMPPTITLQQMKGFTFYAAKTILTGRGDELLDLAETNVLQRVLS
ncbi:MAG: ubiquinone-dependent pyruvate dehydrogenase, partial [Acidobacteriaceae bacterium]|nr:ubiquinone-dependent pyruvate dehydrogenase [Acidobacteriaceae bacterium]